MKEEQQNTIAVFLALALGVMIGKNWPQINKNLQPLLKGLEKQYGNFSFATLGALAGQKEKFEDMMAGRQAKQKTKKKAIKTAIKKQVKK